LRRTGAGRKNVPVKKKAVSRVRRSRSGEKERFFYSLEIPSHLSQWKRKARKRKLVGKKGVDGRRRDLYAEPGRERTIATLTLEQTRQHPRRKSKKG